MLASDSWEIRQLFVAEHVIRASSVADRSRTCRDTDRPLIGDIAESHLLPPTYENWKDTMRTSLIPVMTVVDDSTSPSGTSDANRSAPTIVLVHGAWADSSSWSPVVERLRGDGYDIRSIANPLQGLDADTAYLSSHLATIDGPIVLVGHSYGGAVISNIDTSAFDIRSLVYIAAFIPLKDETVGQLAAQSTPALPLIPVQVPDGTEVTIDQTAFAAAFAGDLDQNTAANLAVAQRPANVKAVSEPSVNEAFRSIPSWALITRQDQAIAYDLQRLMVDRTDADVTEVDASHAVMLSRPDAVADLIKQAAR
ncbi:alpha/beta hydrolase [Aeromicrobium wangtongii]|uniref:Alpha/beta hydrolase n=1 Tax=Aeromicrobium wangtongii TaxID=2969247 RepID=A0ABY5M5I3_9ACTN|nr:alpha/beta hydrolase [Aeromicrobium wangtongii]MCD9198222.1 alpha/beta hydrolase [Aeromicrobium wangtongii]UUP12258.1 alpha/beta hydrolase [Aeromicrobium wangtongii]